MSRGETTGGVGGGTPPTFESVGKSVHFSAFVGKSRAFVGKSADTSKIERRKQKEVGR